MATLGRSAVHGIPTGHAGLVLNDDDGSLGNSVGLGMRDGEALHHARGALGLTGQEGVHHGVGVVGDTGLDSLVGDKALRASSREAKSSETNTFSTFTKSAASDLGSLTAAA